MKEEKKILLFGCTDVAGRARAKALQQMAEGRGAAVYSLGEEFHTMPLGMLMLTAGTDAPGPSRTDAPKEALPGRMLVFGGFSQDELEEILSLCRSCGFTREDLKAVLTRSNASWTAPRLARELTEEHRRMSGPH